MTRDRYGDFPHSKIYHKSGYQTLTDAYVGKWVNTDDDSVGEDIDFESILSVETTDDGADFLAVGGMYPVEESVVTDITKRLFTNGLNAYRYGARLRHFSRLIFALLQRRATDAVVVYPLY